MQITIEEMRRKEVINMPDGSCFGFADDVVIDTETRKVSAIIIRGKPRFFGIFGREEDVKIGWEEIETIGKDTILVQTKIKMTNFKENENIFQKFFNIFL
ncbi:MAG: YlmC/YmxH family sporulation protein [Oscillospiraceae bacterium]|nr:YlmC/YmxH family sporulation protein [Oscillospiraceae bacterium]